MLDVCQIIYTHICPIRWENAGETKSIRGAVMNHSRLPQSMGLTNSSSKFHRVSRCCRPGAHVYTSKVCGVRWLRSNWKLLYGNKGLSIVSATKLAKKYQLNFDLVLLFLWAFSSSKTWPERHPECTDRSCNKALTVRNQELPVSNVTPWAMTYLEIQRTDHLLHPMTP